MKRLIATVGISLALILSLHDADAMWPELSQMELIEQSNLIVTGSLIGRTAVAVQPEGVNLTLGVISIETVLCGSWGCAHRRKAASISPTIHSASSRWQKLQDKSKR